MTKILIISYDYRPRVGGVATCSYELATALSAIEGVDVKLIAPSISGAEKFDQHNLFSTQRIKLNSRAITSIFPLTNAINKEIKNYGPNAIINMLWMPDGVSTYLANTQDIPIFQMVHAMEVIETYSNLRKILRSFLSPLKKKVINSSNEVFCVSKFTKDLVKKFCQTDENKLSVINNGINPHSFYPTKKNPNLIHRFNLENKFCFFTISRIKMFKGMDNAIWAMKQVKEELPDFKYIIGGVGPDTNKLKKLIEDEEMSDYVEMVGKIPNDEIIDYYNLSDCFITLSREDYNTPNIEGFGLVFLEAAACKVPSLAANTGGIPDAVTNETGWKVNPTNIIEIKKTLTHILQTPEEVKTKGENAYHRATTEMTWNHMAEKLFKRIQTHLI